jgi:hypothetical protein
MTMKKAATESARKFEKEYSQRQQKVEAKRLAAQARKRLAKTEARRTKDDV